MKQKLFLMLAAMMLLVSTSASAQNVQQKEVKDTAAVAAKTKAEKQAAPKKTESQTQLKGDVNEDGKVDVADIAAIIAIMKANGGVDEEPALYWYVGQIMPTDPKNAEQNTGVNKWTQLTSTPSQLAIESQPSVGRWYVAIPHEYGFQVYDTTGTCPDTAAYNKSQININSVSYDLFTSSNQMLKVNAVFKP